MKNLSVKRWMRTGMGSIFRELCRWEVGVVNLYPYVTLTNSVGFV